MSAWSFSVSEDVDPPSKSSDFVRKSKKNPANHDESSIFRHVFGSRNRIVAVPRIRGPRLRGQDPFQGVLKVEVIAETLQV